jgi:ribosome-associated protein
LTPPSSKEKAILCARAALDHKAIDLAILDVKKLSSFADFFVISSGRSDRQVQAIASHIEEKLGKQGLHPLGVEGKREGRWVLSSGSEFLIASSRRRFHLRLFTGNPFRVESYFFYISDP